MSFRRDKMSSNSHFKARKFFGLTMRVLTMMMFVVNAMAFPMPVAHAQSGAIKLFASGLWGPFGMAFDAAGNLFAANEGDGGNGDRVDMVSPDGMITPYATGFSGVSGAAFNSSGALFVSDDTNRVFRIDDVESYTVFIDETIGLDNPNAIAFDSADNLYVVSAGGFVSRFDSSGALTELNFVGDLNTPEAIVIDDANNRFFVSDMNGNVNSVDLALG
jgi:DNA-binding beta-propeller fold protein YncE